jgi:hypothetical protein
MLKYVRVDLVLFYRRLDVNFSEGQELLIKTWIVFFLEKINILSDTLADIKLAKE